MQTGLPEQLRTDSKSAGPPEDGVSTPWKCCSRQLVGCPVEHSWDVDGTKGPQMLLTPEEEGGGRVATCDGSVNRLAGWYTQRSQCCPYGPERPCPEGALWGGSRPGVLPAARGNWYANAVGDPSRPLTLRARCTWLPSQWPRHPWIPPHAWIPAPGALLPEGTRDLTTGWRFCGRPV